VYQREKKHLDSFQSLVGSKKLSLKIYFEIDEFESCFSEKYMFNRLILGEL